jgi:localization factor PodJL
MKLGVPWTSKGKKSHEPLAANGDADAASVHERLDDLARQLERLSRITAGKVLPAGPASAPVTRDRSSPDGDPAVLQQLESAITGLRTIVAHVASDDALARLTEDVRGIATQLERTAGPARTESLVNLERQITVIAEAIDASNAQGRQVPAKLETMVRGLTDKIEQLQSGRGDTIAIGQLEDRVAKLVETLDASGSRFSHLEALERGLADLLVHLEEQRARGGALRAAANDPATESLKRELDAVNGTLNRVVERLVTIAAGIRGDTGNRAAPASPCPAPTISPSPQPPTSEVPAVSAGARVLLATSAVRPPSLGKPVAPPSERLTAAARVQRPALRERPPIDPSLPPDHPLEPGGVHSRAAQSPADRIAASEAALGPTKPPVIPDPRGKSNFIAAARRAAQTALQTPPEPGDQNKEKTISADATRKPSRRQRLAGRIRSLLVGASVVILTLGAVHVAMTLMEPHPTGTPAAKKPVPAIQHPPKSSARIRPDQEVTWPERRDAEAPPDHALAPTNSDPAPADRPAAGPGSQIPAAVEQQADVTGSIAPKTGALSEPPTLPMPPTRPTGEAAADPNTRHATAAADDDPAAAYELAVLHIEGRGVPQSYQEAAPLLARASKQGLAPAQFRLGSLYDKGLGVKEDLNEARRLYTAASAKGNAKAMHNLAVLHAEGIDGKPDYITAARWFRKAADHATADSQYNLGVLYGRGVGVEQNLAESYKWFALAAQQGNRESGKKRDEVATRLDAESLMAARLAAKTWTALTEPDEATTDKAPQGGTVREPAPPGKRRPRTGAPMKLGPG